MNVFSKKIATVLTGAALVVAGATAAHAYPAAEGRIGTEAAQVVGKGAKAVIKVTGAASRDGEVVANKNLALKVTTPSGKTVSLGNVLTDDNGNYSYNIKSIATKPGVYKVSVSYKGRVTTVSITVK